MHRILTALGYAYPWLFRSRSAVACLALALTVGVACDPPSSSTIATGYAGPVHIEADGDDLLVVERQGRVWRQTPDGSRSLWLDISERVFQSTSGEQGLLAIALDPASDDVAAHYVDRSNAVVVATFAGGVETQHVRVPQTFEFHKGGHVAYGPDGLLYAALGDDGSGSNAQNMATYKGKLIRIDTSTGAVEIYARGLRNPYRFSFDSLTGDLWITDVGSTIAEEINFLPAGAPAGTNFGWPEWEADACKTPPCVLNGETFPVYSYANDSGTCAVIGGFVHRGSIPFLGGSFVFSDLCAGRVWALMDGTRLDVSEWIGLAPQSQIVAVEPDSQGRPIVARLGGQILRVE